MLMLDGDGQHAADDIPNFFDCASRTKARLIIGNRMIRADAMPWLRRKANVWMSRRISVLTGVTLPDSQCGFRLAHLESLLALHLTTAHFEIESEMLTGFLSVGHQLHFVPVQQRSHWAKPHPPHSRRLAVVALAAEPSAKHSENLDRLPATLWTRRQTNLAS